MTSLDVVRVEVGNHLVGTYSDVRSQVDGGEPAVLRCAVDVFDRPEEAEAFERPALLEGRPLQRGSIVNFGSVQGVIATPLSTSYVTSKHAVIGLTKTASEDYAKEGLRINAQVSNNGRRLWWEPLMIIPLIPFLSLIEGIGGFKGFLKYLRREENQFVVIAKPA